MMAGHHLSVQYFRQLAEAAANIADRTKARSVALAALDRLAAMFLIHRRRAVAEAEASFIFPGLAINAGLAAEQAEALSGMAVAVVTFTQ
jgi:hypothetical protein